ncbi:hypothetical protein DPMN_030880 [Dreissena polymorpha]|uniref:Uncharacterized protein n=1 Tax=Dreissena polymorpha TaxID=45954 RepID=A0A9D4M0T6_DREPO|nr:hypothetical protein DPMN_030880 [Dreissena polymorpha]
MNSRLLLVFLGIVQTTFGATSLDPIKTEVVHGKTVKFCTYKGIRLLPKSTLKDYDVCQTCVCSQTGLSCSSMGFTVTDIPADSKCINVKIECKNVWVMKNDTTKKCPKKLIPKKVGAVGK